MKKIVTTEILNFRGSETSIKFDAQRAKRDWEGNDITKTYATKEEFAESLEGIAENADIAKKSARDSKYNAGAAIDAVNNIKSVIDEAAKYEHANIDTILAGSVVAAAVAEHGQLISNVDTYHAEAANGNVDIHNANDSAVGEYINALIDITRQLVDYGVFCGVPCGGIQIPKILEKYITLEPSKKVQAVSTNGNLTGAWEFPINLI